MPAKRQILKFYVGSGKKSTGINGGTPLETQGTNMVAQVPCVCSPYLTYTDSTHENTVSHVKASNVIRTKEAISTSINTKI